MTQHLQKVKNKNNQENKTIILFEMKKCTLKISILRENQWKNEKYPLWICYFCTKI